MKDVYLIVRPHPREYPNKRENVKAVIPDRRIKIFQNLPHNVLVDSPILKFPLENHFQSVDVLTTGWSSVGLDWQIRGKPTVTYDGNLTWYPPETHYSGTSVEEYFHNLMSVVAGEHVLNNTHTRNAISWYCFSNFKKSTRIASSLFDEKIVGSFFVKMKISSVLSRFTPKLYMKLRMSRIVTKSDWKGILGLFEIPGY
jgi:CDP-glycerol glycerophosphotransferase (TagB/SpsB family)